MRFLYSLILVILLPFIFLRLLWKSIKLPDYRKRLLERLGIFNVSQKIKHGGIWIHAVSVGEVISTYPLVKKLLSTYPKLPITITTSTPTGYDRIKQLFSDNVYYVYLPYDLPLFLHNFIIKIQPNYLIIMETELWPNLLNICNKSKIVITIVNGRLSDKSFANYKKIKWFVKSMLVNINVVATQSQQDAERFMQLGFDKNKLFITGNLKFDIEMPKLNLNITNNKIVDRLVWIAASTHKGEELIVLQIYKKLKTKIRNLLLILVPRHPDRFLEVSKLIENNKLSYVQHSKQQSPDLKTDILLVDTMGELYHFYSIADIAFVGGSLTSIGGHNLLEPAAFGIPIVTGKYLFNFREISTKLLEVKALSIVHNSNELLKQMQIWCENSELRRNTGKNGCKVIINNKGTLDKIMNIIKWQIKQPI